MFQIHHVKASDVLETTLEGALDFERTRAALEGIALANAETGYDLLIDLRAAEDAGISFPDVYRLVMGLSTHPESFKGRVALLDHYRDGFEKVQFFEAAATEKGYRVRAFADFEKATRWLQETKRTR